MMVDMVGYGRTPLHHAAHLANVSMLRALHAAGAKTDILDLKANSAAELVHKSMPDSHAPELLTEVCTLAMGPHMQAMGPQPAAHGTHTQPMGPQPLTRSAATWQVLAPKVKAAANAARAVSKLRAANKPGRMAQVLPNANGIEGLLPAQWWHGGGRWRQACSQSASSPPARSRAAAGLHCEWSRWPKLTG